MDRERTTTAVVSPFQHAFTEPTWRSRPWHRRSRGYPARSSRRSHHVVIATSRVDFRCLPKVFKLRGVDMPLVKVNGRSVRIDGPDDMPLLWALRDILGMTG